MSSDVHEISLKDTVEFIVDNRGKTAPTAQEGIALIATNCVNNNHLYPQRLNLRYVSQETYDTWFRAHPRPGDILLTNKGSQNGAVCLVPELVDFCIAQDMVALRANRKKIYPLYLFAALRSDIVQQRMKALNVDAVIPHLKKTDFDKLFIPMPPKSLQKWIGDFYFELSSRINLLRETNATLEAIAQALFKSWFVDFDPVRARMEGRAPKGMDEATAALFPDEMEESELGAVPRGWGVGALIDVSGLNPESWSTKKHPDIIAYIDLANAKDNEISEVIDYEFDEAPSRARRVLRSGDTIIGTVRPGNRSFAFIHAPPGNLTGSTGFAVLRPSAIENAEFVYLAATQDSSIEHLTHVADGGAYPAVRPDVVSALKCVVPIPEVLKAFHGVTAPLLENICENQRQARTLVLLRDTLLPRLISGQLRLLDVEDQIETIAA